MQLAKNVLRLAPALALCVLLATENSLALDPAYSVTYGAPGVPGRVYDAGQNSTTFTYTVIGHGAAADDFFNKRLKAFKIATPICEPQPDIIAFTPDLPENDTPPYFAGPNPDIYGADPDDPANFDFLGLTFKGWNGKGGLAPLLEIDSQRSFSITYAGNIEVGPALTGTALVSNITGEFVPTNHVVPGSSASCDMPCENRFKIDFDEFLAGENIVDQLQAMGISLLPVNANNSQPHEARIIDTLNPGALNLDLATPNEFYGGSGLPVLDAASGAGLGNHFSQLNALIIPECTDANPDVDFQNTCNAGTGTITFMFAKPVELVALSLIDVETSGGLVDGKKDAVSVFSEVIPAVGDNSLQTLTFSQYSGQELSELSIQLADSAAIDDIILCLPDEPTTPTCLEESIKEQQLTLDGNARQQHNVVNRLAKRLYRNATNQRQKKYSKSSRLEAEKLYQQAWATTWTMNSTYSKCENIADYCTTSNDYEIQTAAYLEITDQLVSLANKVYKKLRRARGGKIRKGDRKLKQRSIFLEKDNQVQVNLIPSETVSCF